MGMTGREAVLEATGETFSARRAALETANIPSEEQADVA
jgi:hypothetical protein